MKEEESSSGLLRNLMSRVFPMPDRIESEAFDRYCGGFADSTSMYLMRSARSFSFFSPANTIFVPGMYFLGLSRYSNSVSRDQTTP